jgi:hypothetical protein
MASGDDGGLADDVSHQHIAIGDFRQERNGDGVDKNAQKLRKGRGGARTPKSIEKDGVDKNAQNPLK